VYGHVTRDQGGAAVAELSNWDIVGRLLLAALVGGAIGFERETDGQDAGLRTHVMLALGAAVFGLISVGAWDRFQDTTNDTNFRVDVTRVASYVAAGIGFVGGGAIVKHAGSVRGLTTAASLWVAGAVGLAAGVGFWLPAVAGTVIGFLSLATRRPLRRLVQYVSSRRVGVVTFVLVVGSDPGDVVDALRNLPTAPAQINVGSGHDDQIEIAARFSPRDREELWKVVHEIAARDDVHDVNLS
jgi:putative Mg2+ transporter-C (MgtC) family protein